MAFIPATNVMQAELVYSWDGQTVENVLHYQRAGGVTAGAMNDLGTALVTWFNGAQKTAVAATASLVEVRIMDLTTEFAPGVTWTAGLPIVGTAAGASLPNNVSLAFTKRTLFRGRAFRGRIYQIGLTETSVTDNKALPAVTVILIPSWLSIITLTLAGVVCPMVVVSRYEGNLPRGSALVTPVVNITTDSVIDSQRRRLPKRGN